jgi:hypothetical protein
MIVVHIVFLVLIALSLEAWALKRPIWIHGRELAPDALVYTFTVLWSSITACYRWGVLPLRRAQEYFSFLKSQGINPVVRGSARLLWRFFRYRVQSVGDVLYDFIQTLALDAFRDGNSQSLALVSLALFFVDDRTLQAHACRDASKAPAAVRLVYAYLVLEEEWSDSRVKITTPIKQLQEKAPQVLEDREKVSPRGFEREIELLTETLQEGVWPRSLPVVFPAYDPKKLPGLPHALRGILGQHPWLKKALEWLFNSLPRAVIERYLASRQTNAYLLTFKTPGDGHLAPALNTLSNSPNDRGSGPAEEQRRQRFLETHQIVPYSYERYTNNARIGLAPRDEMLGDVAKRLEKDLTTAIGELENASPQDTEVLLHRLGLSGRDYYSVHVPGETNILFSKLQSLLSRTLPPADLLAVIEYHLTPEGVLDGILGCPITDLVELGEDETELVSSNADALRSAALGALSAKTVRDLADALCRRSLSDDEFKKMTDSWKSILLTKPDVVLSDERLGQIARQYLKVLQHLASVRPKK